MDVLMEVFHPYPATFSDNLQIIKPTNKNNIMTYSPEVHLLLVVPRDHSFAVAAGPAIIIKIPIEIKKGSVGGGGRRGGYSSEFLGGVCGWGSPSPNPYFRSKYVIFWHSFPELQASKIHNHFQTSTPKWLKSVPYFRSKIKTQNHTHWHCTCLYSLFRGGGGRLATGRSRSPG